MCHMKLKFRYFDTDVMLSPSNFYYFKYADMNSEKIIAPSDMDAWITAHQSKKDIYFPSLGNRSLRLSRLSSSLWFQLEG